MKDKPYIGLMVNAPCSGSGKTTASLILIRSLQNMGLSVQAFKVGPDFIDPMHLNRISSRSAIQLDCFFMSDDEIRKSFYRYSHKVDAVVIEGTMGMFDGALGGKRETSSAYIAKLLNISVILVLDVARMAQSAAALIHGFSTFDKAIKIKGVVLDRVAGTSHRKAIKNTMEKNMEIPIVGMMPKQKSNLIQERHLGLKLDHESDYGFVDKFVKYISWPSDFTSRFSLEKLEVPRENPPKAIRKTKTNVLLGVARDEAFSFYYEENLQLFKEIGAEIIFFSPLNDTNLPEGLNGIYIGGGYPELYTAQLSSNKRMLDQIRNAFTRGLMLYSECGGFMYLCKGLMPEDGNIHQLAGIFDALTEFPAKRKKIGYREVLLEKKSFLGNKGDVLRGHECHYSGLRDEIPKNEACFKLLDSSGKTVGYDGLLKNNAMGSYVHIYLKSSKKVQKCLLDALTR